MGGCWGAHFPRDQYTSQTSLLRSWARAQEVFWSQISRNLPQHGGPRPGIQLFVDPTLSPVLQWTQSRRESRRERGEGS